MTPEQFAYRWMSLDGPKYRRWSSAWDFCDCYGALVLYFREVYGRELLPEPKKAGGMADGFAALGHLWNETGPQPGACAFMAWDRELPRHCGILLPGGELLHTEAPSQTSAGGPRLTPMRAMARLYEDMRFYVPGERAFSP